jgi:hypothetical protein
MTLLATEIHRHDRPDAVIVFAADRRISRGGLHDSDQPKIFRIPQLSAGIGYFGLAEVPTTSGTEPMAVWLRRFLSRSMASTLADLARDLAAALNDAVPEPWRRQCRCKDDSSNRQPSFGVPRSFAGPH